MYRYGETTQNVLAHIYLQDGIPRPDGRPTTPKNLFLIYTTDEKTYPKHVSYVHFPTDASVFALFGAC